MERQFLRKKPNIEPEKFEKEWKGRYKGRCAILMDGPSLPSVEQLARIRCPVICGNKSFERRAPDIYVMVDPQLSLKIGNNVSMLVPSAKLIMTCYALPNTIAPLTNYWMHTKDANFHFAEDIAYQGWVLCCVMPCAVQVAVYLGFREIVFCGLDLHFLDGKHFYPGGKSTTRYMNVQVEWLAKAKPTLDRLGVKLISTTMKSAERVSEKIPFDKMFP